MAEAVVFAGTLEGRKITEYLCENHIKVAASVATEYGGERLSGLWGLKVHKGRMDREEICLFLKAESPRLVIDATHPYAKEATANIMEACKTTGFPYLRILRDTKSNGEAVYVNSAKEGAEYLNSREGNILLTTGSKELSAFSAIKDYKHRCFARVLPLPQVVEECENLGFRGSHLIAMQGPFSKELNAAMLKQVHAAYLVTKESGRAGGFEEKAKAAAECGVTLVVLGKPEDVPGVSLEEGYRQADKIFGIDVSTEIGILGIGMGSRDLFTEQVIRWIDESDLLIGAKRMVEAADVRGKATFISYDPGEIKDYVEKNRQYRKIAILLSGDVGFFSGAKKLTEIWQDAKVMPGISCLSYFSAKIGKSWENAACASLHGRRDPVIAMLREYGKVFVILGKSHDLSGLCRQLCDCGMEETEVFVGEDLSSSKEAISRGRAAEYLETATSPLCVCLLEWKEERVCTYGIEDSAFIRDKVPMTKEEIRSIVLSKLCLTKKSVVYDIGAGTGSVSVELARTAWQGQVFAIEEKPMAGELVKKNAKAFGAENINLIEGHAPEVLEDLPRPTHAFIGGSGGCLKKIIEKLLGKNPQIRMVLTAVSLESVGEITGEMKRLEENYGRHTEVINVSVAKSKVLGDYHMMMGQNPVYVFVSSK